ncbi:MAG TPA: tryptophan synthase subunit alpha [Nitrososphaeria archaeon]|nr:tryptophan synthase subunit alpha [Nitrososphaeria archaeon]
MEKLREVFQEARRRGRVLFIPFLTGGYPSLEKSLQILVAIAEAGARIIELGIPFSDPIADGTTIQESSFMALQAGATPKKVLKLAEKLSGSYDVSIVILTYLNPVYRMGIRRFFEKARENGVSGIIIPDLPLEEARMVKHVAIEKDVSLILLAAPTTSDERLKLILRETMGFAYLVSLTGTTGEREKLPPTAIQLLQRSKRINQETPVAVGFGISKVSQAIELARLGADGIIVGSKIISAIRENVDGAEEAVRSLVGSFVKALGSGWKSRAES